MDAATFETWLGGIAGLNEAQRRRAFEALALSEAGIGTGIERGDPGPVERSWHDGDAVGSPPATPPKPATIADLGRQRLAATGCPHCGQADIARWGTSSGLPRYRCKACARTFNALTKTPLARLRMRGKWDQQAKAMIDGVSLTKAADRRGVHRTTAFRWRHRFLAALSDDKPKTLNGIVESDETFVLESFKGKRSGLPRKSRKRGGSAAKRGLSVEQIPVIVARDRDGATTDAVLPRLNRASIATALEGVVTRTNAFCCDGGTAIVAFARHAGITAHVLPRPLSETVRGIQSLSAPARM